MPMTMALSSLTLSDCSQNDCAVVVKKQTSITETYETYEDFLESAALRRCSNHGMMVMNAAYSSDGDYGREKEDGKNFCKSTTSQALQDTVKAWCDARGQPTTVTIHVGDRTYQLHKDRLVSKSGYLKHVLMDDQEFRIPSDYPGGPEIFEIVATFCYGEAIEVVASNAAELKCASEYMQMTEEYSTSNLCRKSDLYLTQIALQNWQETMVVLLHCQNLYPFAEDLQIVSHCVKSLAFMACTEMVDQSERDSRPGTSIESQFWSDISASTRDSASPDWWMDDLLRLPCGIFERVIAAIRREGMQEKYVSQAIVKFVDRWVFTSSYPESDVTISDDQLEEDAFDPRSKSSHENLVEVVVRLLPAEKDAVPISFLFSLLRCALACKSSNDCKDQLESRIASQLELATITDFLYPFKVAEEGCISAAEVSCMRRIVNSFMSQQRSFSDSSEALPEITSNEVPENFYCAYAVSAVAKVWDEYLAEVARDLSLTPFKFAELAEVVPSYARATHDHLYRAIHVYLKVHPLFSQEERQLVCRILNCQRLSPEMCTHAVQNELMPLRMIVQAMFMQQLQTRNVLSGHLHIGGQSMRFESLPPASTASFRRNSIGYQIRTESFRSTRESFRSRHGSFDSLGAGDEVGDDGSSLGYILKREAAFRQAALLKADYEATETRLQNLEEELACMKKKIDSGNLPAKRKTDGGNPPVSKYTPERFSSSDRQKRATNLRAVPELTTSDIEDEADVGDVEIAARTGNGVGFITRALSLITLGGYRRRKGDAADSGAESALSEHILCGGRLMWRSNDQVKNKVRTVSGRNLRFQNSSCASASAVKIAHSRTHSLS